MMEEFPDRKLVSSVVIVSIASVFGAFLMGVTYTQEGGIYGINKTWFAGLLAEVIGTLIGLVRIVSELSKRNSTLKEKINNLKKRS